MIRTTLYLPQDLHVRLKAASQLNNVSLSQLAQAILDSGLKPLEKQQADAMWKALDELKGACKAPISDLSVTIDETLYGEKGTWQEQQPNELHE